MSWTAPKTWAVGDTLTSPDMNQFNRDNIAFLGTPPSCRVYNSVTTTVATGTIVELTFDTNRWDILPSGYTGPQHSTTANQSRLTCQAAGKYSLFGHVEWAANATGYRQIFIYVNRTAVPAQQMTNALNGVVTIMSVATEWPLVVGDYVELAVTQNSGGNLTVDAGTASNAYQSDFGFQWVSF